MAVRYFDIKKRGPRNHPLKTRFDEIWSAGMWGLTGKILTYISRLNIENFVLCSHQKYDYLLRSFSSNLTPFPGDPWVPGPEFLIMSLKPPFH